MNLLHLCNRAIEFSFYALFALTPLAFTDKTSELFEFNKMWVVFGLATIVMGAWITKMVLQRRILIQRTLLDIPILLFLASQTISTILSIDNHVSLWGYYSRFNGGLLSVIAYILLYYAFVSNFTQTVTRFIFAGLLGGALVALWGLPSHFGFDPTCFIFRGSLDVSCWTDAFQPKIRMFSTLGQPNWLAAYLAILLPISLALALEKFSSLTKTGEKYYVLSIKYLAENAKNKNFTLATCYILLTTLYFVDLLWTNSQSGFLGFGVSIVVFAGLYYFKGIHDPARNATQRVAGGSRFLILVLLIFALLTFIIGSPISQLNKFTLPALTAQKTNDQKPTTSTGELGGTDSSKIRQIVWKGSLDIWKNNPAFGTGVETFAYAYYKYKPAQHNQTSEWDFLYNKAHNEYLNFAATTGTFGLLTYLLMIFWFLFICFKKLILENSLKIENSKLIIIGLVSGYVSILVTNFFGFSVVITQVYLFLIPALVFALMGMIDDKKVLAFPKHVSSSMYYVSWKSWIAIGFILLTTCYILLTLIRFWFADAAYSKGYNLQRAQVYDKAYTALSQAVALRSSEPVFLDELSYSLAALGFAYSEGQRATEAASFTNQAIEISNNLVDKYPGNIIFWKTRVRIFYTLSQADPRYLPLALSAIEKAYTLAPNDTRVLYNLGVLYGQTGDNKKAVEILEKTVLLKPDYRDAYFALGLFYIELGENEKAVNTLTFILQKLSPNDEEAKKTLTSWNP